MPSSRRFMAHQLASLTLWTSMCVCTEMLKTQTKKRYSMRVGFGVKMVTLPLGQPWNSWPCQDHSPWIKRVGWHPSVGALGDVVKPEVHEVCYCIFQDCSIPVLDWKFIQSSPTVIRIWPVGFLSLLRAVHYTAFGYKRCQCLQHVAACSSWNWTSDNKDV